MNKLNLIAKKLYEAEDTKVPIEPITMQYNNLSIDDAYEIQSINVKKKLTEKLIITGKKIGLTSKAMQESLGVNSPDFGILFDDMEIKNNLIKKGSILQPRVEGELAFILKNEIKETSTIEEVYNCTEYVVPAIEVVGSRIKDWKLTIVDTIADNASCGMYLLSDKKINPKDIDLKKIEMTLIKNGKAINSGKGSEVLGDPANAVLWLAKSLGQYGVKLNAGDIILSGALSAAIQANSGDKFICDYGDYGKVSVDFE